MAGYIKRDIYEEKLESAIDSADGSSIVGGLVLAQAIFHSIPAADVRPVVHARWGADGKCSACGNRWNEYLHDNGDDCGYFDPMPPFCLNCGAMMDLEG